jgi:hypothetical protein
VRALALEHVNEELVLAEAGEAGRDAQVVDAGECALQYEPLLHWHLSFAAVYSQARCELLAERRKVELQKLGVEGCLECYASGVFDERDARVVDVDLLARLERDEKDSVGRVSDSPECLAQCRLIILRDFGCCVSEGPEDAAELDARVEAALILAVSLRFARLARELVLLISDPCYQASYVHLLEVC